MRSIASYLVYVAILVRTAQWFDENPPVRVGVLILLAVYGIILITEPTLTRKFKRYPFFYLPVQTGLVIALMIERPEMDFLPSLFFPLSFQAVKSFKRLGLLWIGGFILAVAGPLLVGWDWEFSGLAMVILFAGLNFLMGGMAYSMERSKIARKESQRLLRELSQAHRQLQEYAEQVEEYAAAQERNRLGRELHDSVTQTLFSMNLAVQAAQLLVDKRPDRVSEQLDRLQELAYGAKSEIQILVKQLQPRSVVEGGLIAALQRLATERQSRDQLKVNLEVTGIEFENNLSEQVTTGLYRLVQEALNNISKHAGVSEAFISLNLECHPAVLEIMDEGVGFDPALTSPNYGHMGLQGMAERACELGWKLAILSQPGKGTTIRVEEGLYVSASPN